MFLINNFEKTKSHLQVIRDLLEKSDSAVFVSPFLSSDPNIILPPTVLKSKFNFTLITTLIPYTDEQYEKVKLFNYLSDEKSTEFNLQILIDKTKNLHAKVYLFKKHDKLFAGIVSSANLTSMGMQTRHEWGVLIDDIKQLKKLEESILSQYYHYLSDSDLKILQQSIPNSNTYVRNNHENNSNFLKMLCNIDSSSEIQYWIKPIGYQDSHISENDFFDDTESALYFTRYPDAIKFNDILIVYGVGTGRILCIHRVTSENIRETTKEDWDLYPWKKRSKYEIKTYNQTPSFGSNWTKYNLYLTDLENEFKNVTGTTIITHNGNSSAIGAIQFGNDKVRVTKNFGEYVFDKLLTIEREEELNE